MNKLNLELTPQQASALLQLLDLSVKAAGLQAAMPAYEIAVLIETALKLPKEENAS